MEVIFEIGLGLLEGGRKYGRHNFRAVGVRASVYFDAAMRHLAAWWEGEDIDPDSGMNHIAKALACLTVFRDAMLQDKWTDDRPPKGRAHWMQDLNKDASAIVDQYPKALEPWTQERMETSELVEEIHTRDEVKGIERHASFKNHPIGCDCPECAPV